MKFLVIGDFHIPTRAKKIPSQFLSLINEEQINVILCTGDFVEERVLNELESIAQTVWVIGNMDFFASSPTKRKLRIGNYSIGLIHGHQIYPRGDKYKLFKIASQMDVNILISGHTHVPSITIFKNVLLLNPGSATGCWSGSGGSLIPSLMILKIENSDLLISLYELKNNKLHKLSRSFKLLNNTINELN
ncbi:MAG: YfcE family phosphodiesterase [Candidatus Methanomethylicota archaeon]|uniref:Phosphoesterase n=1 Tax=Thermoproteota archaeon TaxID=2056631 RepID=A0A497EUK7_9CREN|nr:MAG: YfcE family phosphodiesterase [Candidatus Verstraetearchaeota archaeon]